MNTPIVMFFFALALLLLVYCENHGHLSMFSFWDGKGYYTIEKLAESLFYM